MKDTQHAQTAFKPMSRQGFHFRLAQDEEAFQMSGYKYNAITPFFFKDPTVPIILSEDITLLEPAYIWFSGGTLDVKMGVAVNDFLRYFGSRVIVAKIL